MELMVTTAILAFGIVSIYEAFFMSIDAYGYYTNYFNAQDWVNNTIAEKEEFLIQSQSLEVGMTSGQVIRDQKIFDWTMNISQRDVDQGLYLLTLTLSWQQGGRKVSASRTVFLLPPQLRIYHDKINT